MEQIFKKDAASQSKELHGAGINGPHFKPSFIKDLSQHSSHHLFM
jgi:hypothetical protein